VRTNAYLRRYFHFLWYAFTYLVHILSLLLLWWHRVNDTSPQWEICCHAGSGMSVWSVMTVLALCRIFWCHSCLLFGSAFGVPRCEHPVLPAARGPVGLPLRTALAPLQPLSQPCVASLLAFCQLGAAWIWLPSDGPWNSSWLGLLETSHTHKNQKNGWDFCYYFY